MYIFVKYLRLFVLFSNVNKKIRSAEHNTHTCPQSSNIVVSTLRISDHYQRHTDGPHRPTRARRLRAPKQYSPTYSNQGAGNGTNCSGVSPWPWSLRPKSKSLALALALRPLNACISRSIIINAHDRNVYNTIPRYT